MKLQNLTENYKYFITKCQTKRSYETPMATEENKNMKCDCKQIHTLSAS